jgi:NADH-quinone oxidoreductase subunit F
MLFEQIQAAALSANTQWKNPDIVNIFFSSSAEMAVSSLVLKSLQRALHDHGLPARLLATGPFGYHDLEPLLLIEKPGQPLIWYPAVTPETAAAILRDYLVKANPRPDLALCSVGSPQIQGIPDSSEMGLFSLQDRVALRNCGCIDPEDINDYISRAGGYSGLARVLRLAPAEVIHQMKKSGLRDAINGGDLAAEKWQACHEAERSPKYVICNALDFNPHAMTGRLLLEGDPHSVIEGVLIAAYAIGASQCIIAVDNRYGPAIRRLEKALKQVREYSLSGRHILGADFSVEIQVQELASSLVMAEDTALLSALDGRPAMPYVLPPFPSSGGLRNQPSLIHNIETFARVTSIFQDSSDRSSAGETDIRLNTHIVTLTGAVVHPYTVEVPSGASLRDLVENVGGAPPGRTPKAVQLGGPAGTFYNLESEDITVDLAALQQPGAVSDPATLEVFPVGLCPVEIARAALSFLHDQSCGKCVFCREGAYQMAAILEEISHNRGKPEDLDLLRELGEQMKLGSLCSLGKAAPDPVLSSLNLFKDDYLNHINEKRCSEGKANVSDTNAGNSG